MPTTMSAEAAARMKAPWEAGDFGAISRTVGIPAASAFAAWLDAGGGDEVLDVACGTGSVAVPLARRGVKVAALDISPRLLGEAKAAAMDAGVEIAFDEGQVEDIPYTDASFDLAVSMFGVMFSAEPVAAVSELARVLRPGGRLRLANWTPEGFSGRFPTVVGPFVPPSPLGAASPFIWGDETSVQRMLEPHFDEIAAERICIE